LLYKELKYPIILIWANEVNTIYIDNVLVHTYLTFILVKTTQMQTLLELAI